jgi:hypothetical protein
MGGRSSKPAPPPPPRPPVTPAFQVPVVTTPVKPVVAPVAIQETCELKQVKLNQLNLDTAAKQREVDNCDPAAAKARQKKAAEDASRAWEKEKRVEYTQARDAFYKQIKTTNSLVAANAPLESYVKTLESQAHGLEKKQEKLEHEERKHRRTFLDSDPQSGVPGPTGLETTDDKIMIAFWITYSAALFMFVFLLARFYADRVGGTRAQITTAASVTIAGILIAYVPIAKFA